MHFDFDKKNNMAALNNERLAKIWNPGNVKMQNCSLQFVFFHAKGLYCNVISLT